MRRFFSCCVLAAVACILLNGCSPEPNKPKPGPAKTGGKDHDHDHDHDHEHKGPHDGHFAEIGNHKFHVEWTRNDSGEVHLYILDNKGQKEVPAESEEIVVNTKDDEGSKTYTLTAVDPKDGKTSHYKVTDKDLSNTIDVLSEAITAEIESVKIEGEEYKNVKLVEDPEHHHD